MARIGVAGAAGFIGSHVVEVLRGSGHDVLGVDRPGADLGVARAAGAATTEAPLRSDDEVASVLAGCDCVVNATGLFDLRASKEALDAVNVELARRIVVGARAAGVRRVVHVSSVAVYGAPERLPAREGDALQPRIAYEHSKLAGERAAMREHGRGVEVAVLRPTLVYGPRSRYGHAMLLAMAAQLAAFGRRRVVFLRGGPVSHHVHVRDVARAAELLALHPHAAGRAFNVADEQPIGTGDLACAIFEAAGLEIAFGAQLPLAWSLFRRGVRRLPPAWLARLDRQVERGHRALVRRGNGGVLCPSLDPDWLAYFTEEFVYDCSALRGLGFRCEHPSFVTAFPEVARAYREAGWLPAPSTAS